MPDAAPRHGPLPPDPDLPGAEVGPLAELIRRLRMAGLDPDIKGLSDALWLARWARPPGGAGTGGAGTGGAQGPGSGPHPELPNAETHGAPGEEQGTGVPAREPGAPAPPPGGGSRAPVETFEAIGPDRRAHLYPVSPQRRGTGRGRTAGLPVGAPAAPTLPAPRELQRALRPLQAYRSAAPPLRAELDETATAERSARAGGLILPVHRPVSRGDARLQLVMEVSPSMRVWDRMFGELIQVFGQLGAFRSIRVSHLHTGPDGGIAMSRSADMHAAPLHTADHLSDPTGRSITVLVSDCAGPLWRSGRIHRLLHHLARQAPVAVLQPLPQRMWSRTRLPVTYGELSRGETLGGATALRVHTPAGVASGGPRGAVPVPVLPPEPVALGAWARLLSRIGAGPVAGAVGWVRADPPAVGAPSLRRTLSPVERVSRFLSTASPGAGRLAGYLAAAPLCLPVMQLVQRTMLPDSGPSELAEVLLGGLVTRAGEDQADQGGGGTQWYEMEPEVQEALLAMVGRGEALRVLKHCSEYIEQRFGRRSVNFPALVLDQIGDGESVGRPYPSRGDGEANPVPQPFAEVAVRVLERFMPLPERFRPHGGRDTAVRPSERPGRQAVHQARGLLARFDTEGMLQDLVDAVQLLRGATRHEALAEDDPQLWSEYASCVLRMWEVQGGADLLSEAEAAADRAVAHPHARRERAVLARVLRAAATDRRRRGDPAGALDLLRRADQEYAEACGTPELDQREVLRLTLERAGALEAQWSLDGDSEPLRIAAGLLEALTGAWPDRHLPPELPLARGRILLRLSGTAEDPEQSRRYAEQGTQSLRSAVDDGGGTGTWPVSSRVGALSDLVDALLSSGGALSEAQARIDEALALARSGSERADLLMRAGRISTARYAESGEPGELREAAERFAQAAQRMPREVPAYADALAEWGEVLLRQAAAETGSSAFEFLVQAIRVLRGCRAETPSDSPELAARLLLLGRALLLRYRARGDRVDLREAEYLLGLAGAQARDPLLSAHCWFELGQARFEAYQGLGRPARLDEAVEAFGAAAAAARSAERDAGSPGLREQVVRLGAQAHHWRGTSYEAAARPLAAREAYRAAWTEWSRLPDDSAGTEEPTARQTELRLAELERD
ncbi:SAV_2336 N-terminal domain-related protein [Streptomyces sp. NPDC048278]|uniref:SAV_2336 N-terminal domain-related protein n=1 Tax=Streptomyces sp. NPDC048278 TaxID=3155809 RepID=UPI003422615C